LTFQEIKFSGVRLIESAESNANRKFYKVEGHGNRGTMAFFKIQGIRMSNESRDLNLSNKVAIEIILNQLNGLILHGIKIRKDKMVQFGFGKIESSNNWGFKNNFIVTIGTYCSGWRILSEDLILVGREDLNEEIQNKAVEDIVGQELTLLGVSQPNRNDISFKFSKNVQIDFFSLSREEDHLIVGFFPKNKSIVYSWNLGWRIGLVGPKNSNCE